jgi:hypothetical protein
VSEADATQGDGKGEEKRLGPEGLQRDKGGGKMGRDDGGPQLDTRED